MKTFSNNIYDELSAEDLKIEYYRTESELKNELTEALKKAKGITATNYKSLKNKLIAKLKAIEMAAIDRINRHEKDSKMKPGHPIETFARLLKLSKTHSSHRLRSHYSYDIKDNPEFKKVQNIDEHFEQLCQIFAKQ